MKGGQMGTRKCWPRTLAFPFSFDLQEHTHFNNDSQRVHAHTPLRKRPLLRTLSLLSHHNDWGNHHGYSIYNICIPPGSLRLHGQCPHAGLVGGSHANLVSLPSCASILSQWFHLRSNPLAGRWCATTRLYWGVKDWFGKKYLKELRYQKARSIINTHNTLRMVFHPQKWKTLREFIGYLYNHLLMNSCLEMLTGQPSWTCLWSHEREWFESLSFKH